MQLSSLLGHFGARYAREVRAGVVAVSVMLLDGIARVPAQLQVLRAELGSDMPIWLGGTGALSIDRAQLPPNCLVITDQSELERRLDLLPR